MKRKILGLALMIGLAGLVGCGGGLSAVEGDVTLDGKAVDGATISFIPTEDGKGQPGNAFSDSSGKFSAKTGKKAGLARGTYKVVVTKTKAEEVVDPSKMKPGTPEYEELMKKRMASATGGNPMGGPGKTPGPQSELPEKYSRKNDTPFSVTVPSSGRLTLDLKTK